MTAQNPFGSASGPSRSRARSKRSISRSNSTKARAPCVERGFALGGGRQRGVADRAARMQILRHPGEAGRPIGAEPFELARHGDGRRRRRSPPCPCAPYPAAPPASARSRRRRRGCRAASPRRERAVRIAEAMPAHGHRQHAEPRAQIARHEFHGGDIAAVAGDSTSLRTPARARLSPISVQAAIAVVADSVSVPG